MRVDAFDFDLPEELIALRPLSPRDAARLLLVRETGAREHRRVQELPELLRAGDVLVINDTKVFPARLHGRRLRDGGEGAAIEVLLHKRVSASQFRALVRPAKRLKPGNRVLLGVTLEGTVVSREGAEAEIRFDKAGAALDDAIAAEGETPLPPYIAGRRKPDARDAGDYQTVYAAQSGSVAAPTAGLHFTPELLARLADRGIAPAHVTLHVGAGTFLPVATEDTKDHVMHAEWAELSPETAHMLNRARAAGARIVAVGTTALRLLETAADNDGRVRPFAGETDIFITPGYRFKAVDLVLTNFHLPRSTLFMLVAAFSGLDTMQRAYAHAIAQGYRFYSFGDACLLHPAEGGA
jgi:S-adenosylmethionine:tRNA ribosyltransferase-isomerase